jgi:hypothetical protein
VNQGQDQSQVQHRLQLLLRCEQFCDKRWHRLRSFDQEIWLVLILIFQQGREMTKTYEETVRGTLAELLAWSTSKEILGEITMVIAGAAVGTAEVTADQMVARVREFEAAGMDRKGAIATVADEFDLPKRIVYAAVVDANKMRP